MTNKFKQDKGTAGLTILFSLVVMLFIIGLILMVFALMGSELQTTSYEDTIVQVNNETGSANATGYTLSRTGWRSFNTPTILIVLNGTNNNLIPIANYSLIGNVLYNATPATLNSVKITYTYHYDANTTATDTMYDTTIALKTTTDWFDIFIVIGAMVVLILLTVVIITAIRSSGMVAGGESTKGANTVGTA